MMISSVVKFVKSVTFIKIISPAILLIFVILIQIPIFILGFILIGVVGFCLQLVKLNLLLNLSAGIFHIGDLIIFFVAMIFFFQIFDIIFKMEKCNRPNVFDHIRLCGLFYPFLAYSGYNLSKLYPPSEGIAVFAILFTTVLVDSLFAAIVTNIIMIILMRRRREDMNYKFSFKNILLAVIVPVLILVIWAILMLKSYYDSPKVTIQSSPLPIKVNDQKTVELPSINVPTTLIPVK